MRQVTRKGLMTVAAASGVIAAAGGVAHADSGAQGAAHGSPGVLSGNSVHAPVHAPVNVCGNTVAALGVLNPSAGNSCAHHGGSPSGGHGGARADGDTTGSPGVASGNRVEVPVHVPVNVCGNSVDVVGLGNAAQGNDCASGGPGDRETPDAPGEPGEAEPGTPPTPDEAAPGGSAPDDEPVTRTAPRPRDDVELAATGSELPVGLVLPAGAGALLAGVVLYRRARAAA
ncbi:chaplin [Streptomyces prasinopilosus]|nr:chaplin family protein [Streptomyces prasinopilosus]